MSVITIARQFGAGGKTLGSRVAEKLGYVLIDDQIVVQPDLDNKICVVIIQAIRDR